MKTVVRKQRVVARLRIERRHRLNEIPPARFGEDVELPVLGMRPLAEVVFLYEEMPVRVMPLRLAHRRKRRNKCPAAVERIRRIMIRTAGENRMLAIGDQLPQPRALLHQLAGIRLYDLPLVRSELAHHAAADEDRLLARDHLERQVAVRLRQSDGAIELIAPPLIQMVAGLASPVLRASRTFCTSAPILSEGPTVNSNADAVNHADKRAETMIFMLRPASSPRWTSSGRFSSSEW